VKHQPLTELPSTGNKQPASETQTTGRGFCSVRLHLLQRRFLFRHPFLHMNQLTSIVKNSFYLSIISLLPVQVIIIDQKTEYLTVRPVPLNFYCEILIMIEVF